jgi:hypothetical protein
MATMKEILVEPRNVETLHRMMVPTAKSGLWDAMLDALGGMAKTISAFAG